MLPRRQATDKSIPEAVSVITALVLPEDATVELVKV